MSHNKIDDSQGSVLRSVDDSLIIGNSSVVLETDIQGGFFLAVFLFNSNLYFS